MSFADETAAVRLLRNPKTIRERCQELLMLAEADRLLHFRLHRECLDETVDYVLATIEDHYPNLDIPPHSRWRHFQVGGIDRWNLLSDKYQGNSPEDIARMRIDLAVTSVLLDAGAGDKWRYVEAESGISYTRSEGLALASLQMFATGTFSSDPANPMQADATGLTSVQTADLDRAFQIRTSNPLIGVPGRVALLRSLGQALPMHPDLFGEQCPRVGNLFDYLASRAIDRQLPAAEIFAAILRGLATIWPRRLLLGGENLGDVWRHRAIRRDDRSDGLVPFHKLSQWLSYSLIEPMEDAGIRVTGLEVLTGLPEYRNGGLFVDLGVLTLRQPRLALQIHEPGSELVTEWRALTVALLDELAKLMRTRLKLGIEDLPLVQILEGGTWISGRKTAAEHRAGGGPPIVVRSDGTVF